MSADNTPENLPNSENGSQNKGQSLDLDAIKAQLAELAENQKVTMETVSTVAQRIRQPAPEPEDDNLYEPQNLLRKADRIVEEKLARRDALNAKIAEVSREYPELNSDAKLIQSVVAEAKNLPSHLQQTPEGYEMAMLRAATKAGLVPKSKRSTSTVDDDVSMSNSGERTRAPKKVKITEAQLRLAELMGRDINDPEYLKRLEKANQRARWNKYE
jgi:hypothetical protein